MSKVSVVMATYNNVKTIDQAIQSILNQSEQAFELIVVDDCSSDGTDEALGKYKPDERICVITNSVNRGSGYSRNLAIKASRSPWIAVQDADDISFPNRLEELLRVAEQNSELSVVSSQVAEFGAWGGPVGSKWRNSRAEAADRHRRGKMPVPHCAAMIRRADLLAAGGYDIYCRRAQDFALFRKLPEDGFVCLDVPLLLYRTQRPLPLEYAILSGRYGRLARIRTRRSEPKLNARVQSFPESIPTDVRSIITWARRRLLER